MLRCPLVVGNWKMNGLIETAQDLVDRVQAGISDREGRQRMCEVVVCPPYTALHTINSRLGESALKLGGQNMGVEVEGAFTGEVSGIMLRNCGCRYVILGHSERRALFGETDEMVSWKVKSAFRDGLNPIVCVGEELAERERGETLQVVERQFLAVLPSLPESPAKRPALVLAYEPVWAIGTGKTATPAQVQEVHHYLRGLLKKHLPDTADKVRILYGGSIKPSNAAEILAQEDVDGGLIGGAALNANDFLDIVDAIPDLT
ncbi:MAG: triose-phosphate isomerase [Magnetococcales bacterium]|nr:triose-phosphate isomerase [Magnetococcales bacterium]